MLRKNSSNQKGFTFIEALVSLGVLTLVFAGVLTMTITNIQSNSFARNHTRAVQLAEEGVERYLSIDFDALLLIISGGSSPVIETNMPKNLGFTRTTTLTSIDTDNVSITSSVRWRRVGTYSKPINISIIRTR